LAKNKKMEEQNLSNSSENSGVVDSQILQVPIANDNNVVQVRYAGFWIRWVAVFIDGIIVSIVVIPVAIAFAFINYSELDLLEDSYGVNFIGYLIAWGYYIFMTDKYQATLGKRWMGIKVANEDFTKAPLGKIILRETVGKIISGFILCIGYIMAAFGPKKRALHDVISGTVVIYDPNSKSNKGMVIGIVVACILFFIVIMGILASITLVSLNSAREEAQKKADEAREKSIEIQHQIENVSGVE
jgi:uncharacterized RDD family membrane protein YckC